MGFLDSLLGRGQEEDEEDLGFEETEEEFEDLEDEFDEDEEEIEELEWENAYEFSKEAIEAQGFNDMKEFVAKAMVYRINNSERYRDRIAIGRDTMSMINETANMAQGLGGDGETNWEQAAEKLKGARQVKEEMDKMVDKEEMMLDELMSMGQDVIGIVKDRGGISAGGVDTGVRHSDDDL